MSQVRFGDPSRFAVDVVRQAYLGAPRRTLWGRMRVWLNGEALYHFEREHCGLSAPIAALADIAVLLPALWHRRLEGLADSDVALFLDRALYGDDARSELEVEEDAEAFSRHIFLTNTSECFDGYSGFAFCRPGSVPVIAVRCPNDVWRTVSVSVGDFRAVTNALATWHEAALVA